MELYNKLLEVSRLFRIEHEYLGYEVIQMGNVNRTYKVNFKRADGSPKSYLIQNVNTYAFQNAESGDIMVQKAPAKLCAFRYIQYC